MGSAELFRARPSGAPGHGETARRSTEDASGLLTTTLQLGQVIGVAVFGSIFLSLAARAGQPGLPASPHAIAATSGWLALLFA